MRGPHRLVSEECHSISLASSWINTCQIDIERKNLIRPKTILEFAALSAILAVLPLMSTTVPAVHAYGNTALWQIGVSLNCNNPSFCGSMLGGFWGWVEFDSGGLGDATLTGCGHLTGPTSHGTAGADHFNVEITGWTIMPGSAGPITFFVTSGTMTFTGTIPS